MAHKDIIIVDSLETRDEKLYAARPDGSEIAIDPADFTHLSLGEISFFNEYHIALDEHGNVAALAHTSVADESIAITYNYIEASPKHQGEGYEDMLLNHLKGVAEERGKELHDAEEANVDPYGANHEPADWQGFVKKDTSDRHR